MFVPFADAAVINVEGLDGTGGRRTDLLKPPAMGENVEE
jgi:hypothetical protein